jgi:hypothetical protein
VTPAHLAVIRACGVAARISFFSERRGVAGRGVFSDARVRSTRDVSHTFALLPGSKAAHDRSTHLSMREIVRRIMIAPLCVGTGGACFRRRRLHAVRPSCCHVGGIATNPVRARRGIRLSAFPRPRHVAVLRVSAFTVPSRGSIQGTAFASSLLAELGRDHHLRLTSDFQDEIAFGDPSKAGVDSGERRSEGRFVFRRVGLPSSPRGVSAVGSQSTGSRSVPRFGGTTLAGR